jgi:hypothetical protein
MSPPRVPGGTARTLTTVARKDGPWPGMFDRAGSAADAHAKLDRLG